MLPLIMVGVFRDPNYIIILDFKWIVLGHDNNRRVFRFFNSYKLEELLILRAISLRLLLRPTITIPYVFAISVCHKFKIQLLYVIVYM